MTLSIPEIRQLVGRSCAVTWTDRLGNEQNKVLQINDVSFVPLYGAYLVGDIEDVSLERVTGIQPLD